ncbi:hypothetical protein BBO99_00006662 [Phytophthora kernoviae]|uniref:Uncharacterized protein n=2 Tax=Phytophthora kernoviae TaxID=325452 RepID=A0A3R7HUI7_9STRA|nr:hypothetical protein G195_008516 [Phytophthora kernoviae 00238/432]KAG2519979.1 hypothetical protein JM16_006924 [Phytophthora kernoviae]KAG2520453.1 hypothetical protein JM18_006797 [Phytophthora kernoviae]RLN44997.1 hypothetical protein BBI17_006167 [Phytophthora kernoviae]RLN77541.1 hypothetical protein BBO99_00006662 [Phytophthora kernoviae]
MRQRASTKTQRKLRQHQLRDPYALTDDVYSDAPTFRIGGIVTAIGALQLAAVVALSGLVFGSALLFCMLLLTVLGLVLLHHSNASGPTRMGLKKTLSKLMVLRRGALDYSLTLSIARSQPCQEKREMQIAVVPSSPTPQKVVATMALTQTESSKAQQSRRISPLAGDAPLVTLDHVDMKPLPTINSLLSGHDEELVMEKPRAKSEPKQVLRSQSLLFQPKPKVQEKMTVVKEMSVVPKTLSTPKAPKAQKKMQPKPQQVQVAPKMQLAVKEPELPTVSAKSEPKLMKLKPESTPVQTVPAPPVAVLVEACVPEVVVSAPRAAPSMPVLFPEQKPIVELARGEPTMERELVTTRNVLLYLKPEGIETIVMTKEQELEQELKQAWAEEQEQEDIAFSMESFPPLSPPMSPMLPPVSRVNTVEPNFLLDIVLEPISKPEKKVLSLKELTPRRVHNADLRGMLDELDLMGVELAAAMASCTRLLNGEKERHDTHMTTVHRYMHF